MAGMGPVKKDPSQRRRRNAEPTRTKLPAAGRKGQAPAWPLVHNATSSERKVWNEIWKTPQSVAWERLGWTRVVARYVRLVLPVESGTATTAEASEVRQLEDRLGLTPMSMLRLQWEIGLDEVAEVREARRESVRRLKAVDPRAVAGS